MNEERNGLSDEVLIEIVHNIKDIIMELINKAFPRSESLRKGGTAE